MKAYKTVIFIFCVLIGLGAISLLFPREGVVLGGATLEFPSLTEALTPTEDTSEQEAALQAHLDSMQHIKDLKDAEFQEFCLTNPARIHMPGDNLAYLDEVFTALEKSDSVPARIVHYGDSQLECDLMSAFLREQLQDLFGGGGVGMLPAVQPVEKYTVAQRATPALARHCPYGSKEMRVSNRQYGPLAQMSHISGSATLNFLLTRNEKFPHAHSFEKISVALMGSGSVTASVGGKSYELKPEFSGDGLTIRTVTLPEPAIRATINVSGEMDIYGIMLDSNEGMTLDNVPMRGCSGTIFSQISEKTFQPFFAHRNVPLIILQYGGNSMPYTKTQAQINAYAEQIRRELQWFKRIAPESKILFIGPSDMATMIGGKRQTYKWMEDMCNTLCRVVNEEGFAYWNMYEAMGGNGSMVEWVNAHPQLAHRDYIHFTPLGSEKMSGILFDTLKLYYNYYRFRTGKDAPEQETEVADSLDNRKTQTP